MGIEHRRNRVGFSAFFANPLICDGKGKHISISDITLRNAFFEKMFGLFVTVTQLKTQELWRFFGRCMKSIYKN